MQWLRRSQAAGSPAAAGRSIATSVAILDASRHPSAATGLSLPGRPPASDPQDGAQTAAPTGSGGDGGSPADGPAAAAGATSASGAPPAARAVDAVYNLPNAVSVARLASGPVIGYWLLQGEYEVATIALAVSGASDWLDGFLARRMGASSVFGSYLDPLADKVLIGCVAAALLANGAMPAWLAVVVVGRDVLLVCGAFVVRLRGFGWRWPGREAFFRTADAAVPQRSPPSGGAAAAATAVAPADAATVHLGAAAGADAGAGAGATVGSSSGAGEGGGVPLMRPLLVSKANTVLQLVLLGGYLTRGMYGWPDGDTVAALELATAATTVASLAAYGTKALRGKLFA